MTTAQPSAMSQYVELCRKPYEGGTEPRKLGEATSFIVESRGRWYVCTNWHVVTGVDPERDRMLSGYEQSPDIMRIHFAGPPGEPPVVWEIELYQPGGGARWLIHPELGRNLDIALIPVDATPDVATLVRPHTVTPPWRAFHLGVTTDVQIIGFPYGYRGTGAYAIWTRGTVATEPELDVNGQRLFLVDARARRGQSGSPVISFHPAMEMARNAAGSSDVVNYDRYEFLGVYSGRINSDSDLGRVWKKELIAEIDENWRYDDFQPRGDSAMA